jgi:hypothetical protein
MNCLKRHHVMRAVTFLIRKPASQLRIPGTIYNKGWAKDTAGRPRIIKIMIMVFIATSQ